MFPGQVIKVFTLPSNSQAASFFASLAGLNGVQLKPMSQSARLASSKSKSPSLGAGLPSNKGEQLRRLPFVSHFIF
jgi:hypothetical protein